MCDLIDSRDRWRLSASVSRDRLAAFRARGLACALCTRETISLSANSRLSTFPDYIADPSLSVRERLSPSLIRVRHPHSDLHTWTCSLSDYMETCAHWSCRRLAAVSRAVETRPLWARGRLSVTILAETFSA
jgi:hypothetical protein